MKFFTVVDEKIGNIVYGSAEYPCMSSREPDIYVSQLEYSGEKYEKIRSEADCWRISFNSYQEDDHGYDQQSSECKKQNRAITDEEILVKDGCFFGIISAVDRSFRTKSPEFHKRLEYVSINTAHIKHGLWIYHNGYSSDSGSSSNDIVYYLHPLYEENCQK